MPAGSAPGEVLPSGEVPGGVPAEGGGMFAVAPPGEVPAEEMVVAADSDGGDGVLVLVSAGVDSLTVRWVESFAPDAAGFRLRWRERPVREGQELLWQSADVGASVRTYTIGGLTAGTRYRLRLVALDGDGGEDEVAVAGFETLAPPVRNLTGAAVAHDAVTLTWDGPADWSPVGYVVQWRRRGPNEFLGRLELPPGRRSQIVEGLTGGVEYVFRVTARTAAGWQSKPAAIGVITPAAPDTDLVLEISVPSYCIADEGRQFGGSPFGIDPDTYTEIVDPDAEFFETAYQRDDVETVPLQWRITGGKAPYTLTVAGTRHSGATGTTEVSCATAGLDLMDLPSHETSVVEAGAKTLTIEAADATGDTTTRTATIEIIERAHTAGNEHEGDYLEPGRTYSHFGLFIEIPEGTRIAYGGAVEADDVYDAFTELPEGSRITDILIQPSTGEEAPASISRTVYKLDEAGRIFPDFGTPLTDAENAMWDLFLANIRTTPFPEGDTRNEPPDPLAPSGRGAARQAASAAAQCSNDGTTLMDFTSDRWRPYGTVPNITPVRHGLSCDRLVAVHPSMLVGDAITVCVQGGARDGLLVPAVATATGDWNDLLAPDHANPDPALRRGLGYAPFSFDTTNPDCPTGLAATDTDHIQVFDGRRCHANTGTDCPGGGSPAVARTRKSLDPPRIEWNIMQISIAAGSGSNASQREDAIRRELERLVRHELGHFLGLADYFEGCWRLVDSAGTVQPSTMSYGRLAGLTPDGTADPAGCRSDHAVTPRDLEDVHAMYHPLAVSTLSLEESARAGRWQLRWRTPVATPSTFNAAFLGVVRRELLAAQSVGGAPSGPAAWELFGLQSPEQDLYRLPASADVRGYEYAVVGLTRGDHRRGLGADVGLGLRHRALAFTVGRAWTAGSAFSTVSAAPTQVAIAAQAAPITEGASIVFAVSRTGATSSALTVDVRVTETGDMVAAGEEGSRSVTIPFGDSSASFTVATVDDSDIEPDSAVAVTVTSGVGYGVVSPGSASVTVTDDDLPLVAVGAAGSPITEGDSAHFALSRTGSTTSPLTVDLTVSETGGDMVAPTDEGSRSVTIPAGDSSASFAVATVDDSDDESDSTVTVSISSGAGYGVVSPGSARVIVNDDDTAPVAYVFPSVRSTLPVTEGASLIFEVSRSFRDPVTAPLTVNLRVTEIGDAVAATDLGARSVTIAVGDSSVTFSVLTVDDTVAEGDSVVTVELTGGTGYSFSPFYSKSVAVYDNDDTPPTVAIRPVESPIFEDWYPEFTVIHTGATTAPLTVALTVTETGDTLYPTEKGSRSFTIPAGTNSATLRLDTVNDADDDWLSTVTVAVASGTGYSVGSPGSASVVVYSDDVPSIGVDPSVSPVSEGTAASFTVRHQYGPSTQPTEVELRITETGDMISPTPLVSVTIPTGDTSAAFDVPTIDDGDTEVDSVVTVVIVSVDGHLGAVHPSSDGASASVVIHDNENTAPRVTISPPRFAPTEGAPATFTVSRSGATSSALTVALSVTETGDVVSAAPTSVTIPAGEASVTFEVPTIDDSADEDDSTITAHVAGGSGYAIGIPGSASIPVYDNDTSRLPQVDILQGTWDTIEGGGVSFTVSRAGPRGLPLTVALRVTETGDTLAGVVPTLVTIPAVETAVTFEVSTADDGVEEDDSTVTAAIVSGAGYTVGTPGSVSVSVYDNDGPPTVSIRPYFASTEARPARFIVSRAGSAASALTVELTVTETGDMIDPAHEGFASVVIPAGAVRATLEVPTTDDDVDEDNSTVTATINSGAGYAVGSPNAASVTVFDNDDPPTVTVRSTSGVHEGGFVRFIISRTGSRGSYLVVDLDVTETGDMIDPDDEGPTSSTIYSGDSSATLYVATVDDAVAEDDSTVTATITTSTRYATGTPGSASVTVYDEDSTPTDTILATAYGVTEGTAARLTVYRSGPTTSPLTVELTVSETGDMIDPSHEGPTSFTIPAGDISATFEVPTVDDATDEPDSYLTVTISQDGGHTFGRVTSVQVIVIDNDLPTITIQPGTSPVTEGASARFTVDRTGLTTFGLTIDLIVSETGDMIHTDNVGSTSVRFRAGETTATLDVPTVDDTLAEDDSTITATIARNSRYYTIGTPGSATITANDNDPAPPTVNATASPTTEGDIARFTVDRTGPTTAALTIRCSKTANLSGSPPCERVQNDSMTAVTPSRRVLGRSAAPPNALATAARRAG